MLSTAMEMAQLCVVFMMDTQHHRFIKARRRIKYLLRLTTRDMALSTIREGFGQAEVQHPERAFVPPLICKAEGNVLVLG